MDAFYCVYQARSRLGCEIDVEACLDTSDLNQTGAFASCMMITTLNLGLQLKQDDQHSEIDNYLLHHEVLSTTSLFPYTIHG